MIRTGQVPGSRSGEMLDVLIARYAPDDGAGAGGEGAGSGDGGSGAGDGGAGAAGTGSDGKPFDADRAQRTIDALRAEVKTGKATAAELAKAQARLKEIEDAGRSETEKLAARATEASEKLSASEARAQNLAIRLAVERAARKLNFIDEDDAYRLLDRSAVEMDDDGDPKNVEALLTALGKSKPHLIKTEGTNGTRSVPATGKPGQANGTREKDIADRHQKLVASGNYPKF